MESKENVQKGNGLVYFPGPDVPKIFIVQVFAKTLFKLSGFLCMRYMNTQWEKGAKESLLAGEEKTPLLV